MTTEQKDSKILKDVMLGLIYPAVLGTILYNTADEFAKQFTDILKYIFKEHSPYSISFPLTYKFMITSVSLAFYAADYLYLMFTKVYRWWFFVYDMTFVCFLYLTIYLIDIKTDGAYPSMFYILLIYLLFFVMYIQWDISEKKRVENELQRTTNQTSSIELQAEFNLYKKIVLWEICSIVVIVVLLIANSISSHSTTLWSDFLALTLITCFFWSYTLKRRRFA